MPIFLLLFKAMFVEYEIKNDILERLFHPIAELRTGAALTQCLNGHAT
jgi:hypothetical protein